MKPFQKAFLELALRYEVLKFGAFQLKSGRISPYFFNLGQIADGEAMRILGGAYADALLESGIGFDMLFGPAYKGIPLVTAVAVALAERGRSVPFAYDRKEAKDHGEGGLLIGAKPQGRVVIVDDVLTAGTAMRRAVALLRSAGAQPVAAAIALDRQEVGADSSAGLSAVSQLARDESMQVVSLVNVDVILQYLEGGGFATETLAAVRDYQARYGAR